MPCCCAAIAAPSLLPRWAWDGWLAFGSSLFAFHTRYLRGGCTPLACSPSVLLLPLLPPPLQALQAGLAELRGWVAYVGGEWCCGAEEAESAIERTTQAARYLVQVRQWRWGG